MCVVVMKAKVTVQSIVEEGVREGLVSPDSSLIKKAVDAPKAKRKKKKKVTRVKVNRK